MDAYEQQLLFAAGALACAGIASIHDVRERRIPNVLTGTAMVAGLALHGSAGGWLGLGGSLAAGVAGGGLFLLFFLAGGMGAGDVKLMAAVGCLSGLAALPLLMISTALAGGVFAVAVGVRHGRLRETLRNVGALVRHHGQRGLAVHEELNLSNERTLRLPFALPIAVGCLAVVCKLALGEMI